jgi:hypothetical protein
MLANEHHDRHTQRHAEGENIAEQMTIGPPPPTMMVTPNSATKLAANVVCFRHAKPYPVEAGSKKRCVAVMP